MEEIIEGGGTYSDMLPPSNKEHNLIQYKHNMFLEEKEEDLAVATKKLAILKGSKVCLNRERLRNGCLSTHIRSSSSETASLAEWLFGTSMLATTTQRFPYSRMLLYE